jgi:hypothetical protein
MAGQRPHLAGRRPHGQEANQMNDFASAFHIAFELIGN